MRNLTMLVYALLIAGRSYADNPVIKAIYTADPAALVYKDTFYLYTGHDEQAYGVTGYLMKDWHVFSSTDMVNWTDHGARLSLKTFSWASANAWAGQCINNNGKFYWYVPMSPKTGGAFAIGVAVGDSPTGPFKDTLGVPLITDDMTPDVTYDIDPTIFIDDDKQVYLYWGNGGVCKMVKLKSNMIELDGAISTVEGLTGFTEAAWIHKKDSIYYLSYAAGWPETIDYATSKSPNGPWTYQGRLNGLVTSSTNHQALLEYKGNWYFVYHNAGLPNGGDFRRSVCIDRLYYNADGTIKKIVQTNNGASVGITTDVEDADLFSSLNIYPNPSHEGKIVIEQGNVPLQQGDISILITDMAGKPMFRKTISYGMKTMLETGLSQGIYMLTIQNGKSKSSLTKRLVIY